jgi:hypothetical protein
VTTSLLLALAVAGASPTQSSAPALAGVQPVPASESPSAVPAQSEAPALAAPQLPAPLEAPTETATPDGHSGWRHELDLGAHTTRFSSKEGSDYAFHSATLGYGVSYGLTGPFLRIAAIVPLQATQDGATYATANYYRHREGGDLLVGVQHRFTVRSTEVEVGPGLHGTFIYLPGRAGYRDFTALPLGLGVGASVRWKTSKERLSRVVTWGTTAGIAYDFRDPAHENDITHGFTFRLAIAIGLGARR